MKPGAKPIPFPRAKLQGTDRKDRHGSESEQIVPSVVKFPAPPRNGRGHVLGPVGRKEWNRVRRLMKNTHVITEADRTVLTQYCLLTEQLFTDPAGFKASQHTQLRLCAESLGLTPPGRQRQRAGAD